MEKGERESARGVGERLLLERERERGRGREKEELPILARPGRAAARPTLSSCMCLS